MSYTITYKFGKALDVGDTIAGNHLIRMSMVFTVDTTGTDTEKFSGDYGLKVSSWGELAWARSVDENLMVPGRYEFEIFDEEDELWGLLFEGSLVPYVRKDAKVTLEIKYYGEVSYTEEYVGYLDNTEMNYDKMNKRLSLMAFPNIDKLKNIYLYRQATHADTGREVGSLIALNPLSLSYTVSNDIYTADARKIQDLIHDIYKQLNASVTLSWQHNWIFNGLNSAPDSADFVLEELYMNQNYLSCLFFSIDNMMQMETLYDLLSKWSFTFGFITGMLDANRAFVKDIFYYDASNLQTLGRVRKWNVANKYGDIETVKITSRLYERNTPSGKNAYKEVTNGIVPLTAVIPAGSTVRGNANNIDDEINVMVYSDLIGNLYSDMYALGTYPGAYTIRYARVPHITNYYSLESVVADFYYNLRNKKKSSQLATINFTIGREDEFTVEGINYSYLKDFSYEGNGYQILALRKKLDYNISDISAIVVADVLEDNTPSPDNGYPKPFLNVLPGGYLKDYSFNAEITVDDVNAGTTDLFTIQPGFELKKIIIKTNTKFDTATSMKIVDNDGDLITTDRINNEDDEVIESFQYKNYTSQKTIQVVFTKSGTCTAGDADIIFEVRTRL